jgi:rubrerythrin
MNQKTEERIKALEIALANESRERDFYLKHKERTNNHLGRLMFASIAADESEHYNRILELHKRLKEEGKWPETLPLKVKDTDVKAVVQKMGAVSENTPSGDRDDVEAVKIAIDFETKGELFYKNLASEVENPVEKSFYQFLSGIEREHRLSLEDTLEYFQDPAGWYRRKEHHHLD